MNYSEVGSRAAWRSAMGPAEGPIRAELFSVERLEQHATSLAAAQRVSEGVERGRPLAARLDENAKVLAETYATIVQATRSHQSIPPAAEWLLDNYHVVDEQVREIRDDLPPGYYRKLPKLIDGPLQGYPRVFGISWAVVAHTDSAIDIQKLTHFVDAYQRVQPLTIGELWAIAITLRITLVENLRRVAESIGERLVASRRADALADQLLGPDKSSPAPASLDAIPWSSAFAVQLAQRLRDRDPATTPALRWLNERLAAEGTTTDEIVYAEVQRQSAMNVTVRNVITSMRLISAVDWPEFFESVSLVDAAMRAGSNFAAMDFPTRDLYRRAIETLAYEAQLDEVEVARRAVAAANLAAKGLTKSECARRRECDPGCYLIAEGRRRFEAELGCRVHPKTGLFRSFTDAGVISYVAMIALITALIVLAGLIPVIHYGVGGWVLVALALVGIVPASDLATAIVNRVVTHQVGAMLLPGLELLDGVPDDMRTIIVVPTLLMSVRSIEDQIEQLEVHYLSNSDDNFFFALLSDWADSDSEHAESDDVLLQAAASGIARLNVRYPAGANGDRFLLLHRRRVWNAGEGKWMGWERKRGKLQELNRFLRGETNTTFVPVDGREPVAPANLRYVITLDADTRLPISAGRKLVGKIAHPLNCPCFDPELGRVTLGHAILQPRVTPSLPTGEDGSLFQRVFSGPTGLDPYAIVVSDVYQDLYEEGSFFGKGIYEIDAFEAALDSRVPANAVLSHDLLEGIFARAGLASDIEVVEEFPSRYEVAAARLHRWVRGDWQLLPWIFSDGPAGSARRGRMPLVGRWKLIDNLRRSLSAPSTLLAMIVGWLLPLPAAISWTIFILLMILLPALVPAISALIPSRVGISRRSHVRGVARDIQIGIVQSLFALTFLAHQAWIMVDAIARTIFRLFTRRRLLEWTTTAQMNSAGETDRRTLFVQIAASALFAAAVAAVIVYGGHDSWPAALPFGLLWVVSPAIARWASRPPPALGHLVIVKDDRQALRLAARRTWRFLETFVTEADNFLPPDNFQEIPAPVVAHRTSPTNIGLYLLSVVATRDFGWLGTLDAIDRLEQTFATLDKLETYRGHLYNWYDTTDLRPLDPRYISSVDSGNLAGHLIAMANACREIVNDPVLHPAWRRGLGDGFALIRESLGARSGNESDAVLKEAIEDLEAALNKEPGDLRSSARLLAEIGERCEAIHRLARKLPDDLLHWVDALRISALSHRRDIEEHAAWAVAAEGDDAPPDRSRLIQRVEALAARAVRMFGAMEFGFLYDQNRQLLSIGFRGSDQTLDGNFYDMLASEARLASFIAIAKGDVPAKHWFRLGRTLTPLPGGSALISWSGSMFEYLMPSLVMRAPAGSLLAETNRLVVRRQEIYGEELGVPWGISESAYSARDLEGTYQYSSFGVPDLGYKRGLGENTVIAPYATALAAMIDPAAARRNLERLSQVNGRGVYGWYEALDYTASRLPEGAPVVIVRAYMAHHQAMSLVALANALHEGVMRNRFHAEPIIQAAELLLQERMPRNVVVARPPPEQIAPTIAVESLVPEIQRRYTSPHSRVPRTHLLSNGNYSVMVTTAGSGYSRWRDVAITRWREDVTCDNWGTYFFVRDVQTGDVWSAGYQPTVTQPDRYVAGYTEDRAEFARRDGSITTTLEVVVSAEDDAEVRRVSITNHGTRPRDIELTSYAELALARQADDMAHPAFAKLFVQTEFIPHLGALLATRKRRSDSDPQVWAAHLAVVDGNGAGEVQFETDRARFLGRCQSVRNPVAISEGWPLSNTSGAVLDPIFSVRRRIRVRPGATERVSFWTLAAATRDEIIELVEKHQDAAAYERATTLAWTQAQMQLYHLRISTDEAHLYQRLANHVLYSDPTLRPSPETLKRGGRKASSLWAHGISGDLPIVLVRVEHDDDLNLVRQALRAHEYWRLKQLEADLVILNERVSSYAQDFQQGVESLVRMTQSAAQLAGNVRGGVHVLRSDIVPQEIVDLLQSAARAVLYGQRGSLAEQINRARERRAGTPPPRPRVSSASLPEAPLPRPPLEYFNGLGGFSGDGREYITVLKGSDRTPAPWNNVVANPAFGFVASADGGGFTWSVNSQQNQLTPWSNDPVGDQPGEAIYLRDEDTGQLWTPTALPIRERSATYLARHGQGYTRFEHAAHGIALDLVQFVPVDDSVKIFRLKITNQSGRERRLSVTAYVEWVLASARRIGRSMIVTEINPQTGALFAQNPWSDDFGGRVAFLDMRGRQSSWTGDRSEFLGRDGSMDRPAALIQGGVLSDRVGAGLDPCGVLQANIRLGAIGSVEVVVFLGQGASREESAALVEKYRRLDLDQVFNAVTRQWDDVVGAIQVKTPDRALDIMTNRWLLYQSLSSRVWARAGFYQVSGAYGFRDQLQDVMALCVSRPDIARAHILRAAGRQFREGDTQHWWLAETGRGIRTRVSDDRVWLPFVVSHYVVVTGDVGVLDEPVAFLEGPQLQPEQHDAFFEPATSADKPSLFDHCAVALDASLKTGPHGLPLIGAGDWNDGMDRVGEGGKGESVWLGWFLYSALTSFAMIADRRGADDHSEEWRQHAEALRKALEAQAWDGDWYRRAFFDDGTPLGSVANSDCRIDSIAQSWAVISRAADPVRAARAMAAVDKYLVQRDQKLSLLFTPPFENPSRDPGYIKGYPPGIRENGGQYTHAATWTALAYAMLGDGDRAHELLSMINPISHADNPAAIHRYKVEPYVVSADVYSVHPHVGRGGWTWYTGSAAWVYRITVERLLGFRQQGGSVLIDPCIPRHWPSFQMVYRHGSSTYEIVVENPLGVSSGVLAAKIDGETATGDQKNLVTLADDGKTHRVLIVLG